MSSSHRYPRTARLNELLHEIIDEVERFVWSFPELEVTATDRWWLETD